MHFVSENLWFKYHGFRATPGGIIARKHASHAMAYWKLMIYNTMQLRMKGNIEHTLFTEWQSRHLFC